MARAPVLSHELRYVPVTGFIENHELRDKGRARLTLRVIALGDLPQAERPYRVRVTLPAKGNLIDKTGPSSRSRRRFSRRLSRSSPAGSTSPAKPGSRGSAGPATPRARSSSLEDAREPPWDIAAWAAIDRLRVAINARIRAALPGETGEIAVALITGEQGGISQEVKQSDARFQASRTSSRFPACIW